MLRIGNPGIWLGTAVALCLLPLAGGEHSPATPAREAAYVDVHTHLGGPKTDEEMFGFGGGAGEGGERTRAPGRSHRAAGPARIDWVAAADHLVDLMDRFGVRTSLVMPPPRTSEYVDATERAGLRAAVRKHSDRLVLVGGGDVLNPMIQELAPAEVTGEVRARFRAEAERVLADGARAFGEMAALHLSFSAHHPFEEVQPDHPLFLLLADIAAEHGVPIDLHMEALEEDASTPVGLRRVSPRNPATLSANIAAFERLLAHNVKARIVWQHMGSDTLGTTTVELLRRLLGAHENLFLALRVQMTEIRRRHPIPTSCVEESESLRADWLALLGEFPDRFVIGSDKFTPEAGQTVRTPDGYGETWAMADRLPESLRSKVGWENARRVYGLR